MFVCVLLTFFWIHISIIIYEHIRMYHSQRGIDSPSLPLGGKMTHFSPHIQRSKRGQKRPLFGAPWGGPGTPPPWGGGVPGGQKWPFCPPGGGGGIGLVEINGKSPPKYTLISYFGGPTPPRGKAGGGVPRPPSPRPPFLGPKKTPIFSIFLAYFYDDYISYFLLT